MSLKAFLIFPPGWTLATGSPHLALPLLSAFLKAHGIEVLVRDLNQEIARKLVDLPAVRAEAACTEPTLDNLNAPYFEAEDKLMGIASRYDGVWNAQLGFAFNGSPERSSQKALEALNHESPFTAFYKESVVPFVAQEEPNIIGLCIASVYQLIPSFELCQLLRAVGYSGFIVLGGNTVSRLRKELARAEIFQLVDGLLSFQGERSLLELCRVVQKNQSLRKVPCLTWKDAESVQENPHQSHLDPDGVPTPDFTDLPIGQYWGENYLTMVSARGCYYGKCNFCAIPYGWGNNGYSGVRSSELTYQDMLTLADRHGINRFKFVDEALSPSFMRALSDKINADGVKFDWEGYVRFESSWYDQRFVDHVSRAGFRKGYFGLELIPSNQRDFLNKSDHPKPEALLRTCSSAGVKSHLFCMFGFPGTGEREAADTVEFLLKHQDQIDTADIFPWTYAKHTNIPGVQPVLDVVQDWALEYDHKSVRRNVLSSRAILELACKYEELLWREVPRFLHPTYRLISPWKKRLVGAIPQPANV